MIELLEMENTNEIIKAVNLSFNDLIAGVSFAVQKNSVNIIITAKEETDACLARLLLGFIGPDSGSLSVFGTQVSTASRDQLTQIRQRVGLVYANGGLISNLKIYENVILPLAFSNTMDDNEIEEIATSALSRVGYTGKLMQLPGHTPFHLRKMAGFARAMVMNPDLIIYQSPLIGLNQEERQGFMEIAREFHAEKEGRTSLFISSNPEVTAFFKTAEVITLSTKVLI